MQNISRNTRGLLTAALIVLCLAVAACVALFLAQKATGQSFVATRVVFMTASTAYVLIAILSGAFASWFGRFILLASVFFWHGDLLGPSAFMMGVVAFLCGHLTLVAATVAHGLSRRRCLLSAAIVAVPTAIVLIVFLPHVPPGDRPLILAYCGVISAMVAFAGGVTDSGARSLIIGAAVVFYISDLFVAHWRFMSTTDIDSYFCYPLYYAACVMFALTPLLYDAAEG